MTEPTQADTAVEENLTDPAIQAARMYGSTTDQPRETRALKDPLQEELERRRMYPSSDRERQRRERVERRIAGEDVSESAAENLSDPEVRQRRMYDPPADAETEEGDEETEAEPQAEKQEASDKPAELKAEGVDPDVLTAFQEATKGLGQESAQKVLDAVLPVVRQRQQAAIAGLREEWVESAKGDEELVGSQGFDHSLSLAQKALKQFGTPELINFLDESGLGDHVELVRLLKRVGMRLAHLKE